MKNLKAIHKTQTTQPESPVVYFRPLAVRIPDAVRMTGIGRTKLYALIATGEVTTVKIGRSTLIPVASLEALLHKNKQNPSFENSL